MGEHAYGLSKRLPNSQRAAARRDGLKGRITRSVGRDGVGDLNEREDMSCVVHGRSVTCPAKGS
jgi:hypothetical protein